MKKFFTRVVMGVILLSAFAMPLNAVSPLPENNNISTLLADINVGPKDYTREFRAVIAEPEVDGYVDDMLDFARTFTGLRYRRGGKTPNGFDCSGFTGYVFRQFGMSLGASSRDQYGQGSAVERGDLRPGDLVFFGGSRGGTKSVGHVGIVTSVNAADGTFRFIHSATSSGIIESRSTEPYYSRRYVGARRVCLTE